MPGARRRRVGLTVAVVLTGLVGAALGLLLAGTVTRDVGPFEAQMALRPAWGGGSVVDIPPLGQLELQTHRGPVRLDVSIERLDRVRAQAIVARPALLDSLGSDVDRDVRQGLRAVLLRSLLVAVGGSLLAGALVLRRPRRILLTGATGVAVCLGTAGYGYATLDRAALSEPRFTGLLAFAPAAVGDVQDITARFGAYSRQLGRLVTNVTSLYATTRALPTFQDDDSTLRVLHVSDIHLNPAAFDIMRSVVTQFDIDLIVDTGDLTDHGSSAEDAFTRQIATLGAPYVFVRGNHDSAQTEAAVRALPGASTLDGSTIEVAGLRLLGAGDPRYTPDKTTRDDDAPPSRLTRAGERLAETARRDEPDLVAVHDPVEAEPLLGQVPLVLAGHSHRREVRREDGTTLMIQGSTGGAGLRALEGEEPTPVALTVLYLDPDSHLLQAYDEITLGGLGLTEARIARRVVDAEAAGRVEPTTSPSPGAGGPSPVPTPLVGPQVATPTPMPAPVPSR